MNWLWLFQLIILLCRSFPLQGWSRFTGEEAGSENEGGTYSEGEGGMWGGGVSTVYIHVHDLWAIMAGQQGGSY